MPTESVQFVLAAVSPGGADPAPYTVPGGFLAVLTDVTVSMSNPTENVGTCSVFCDGVAVARLQVGIGVGTTAQWRGRVAVPAAGTIEVVTNSASATFGMSLSGYLYS